MAYQLATKCLHDGNFLWKNHKWDEAGAHWDNGVAFFPFASSFPYPDTKKLFAHLVSCKAIYALSRLGKPSVALFLAQKAASIMEQDEFPLVAYRLALCFWSLNLIEQAQKAYKRGAFSADPSEWLRLKLFG